jgi:hypothetical protein
MKRPKLPKEFEDAVDKVLDYRPPKAKKRRDDVRVSNLESRPEDEQDEGEDKEES